MQATKPHDAANADKFAKLDELLDQLKARIRPGFYGELALRIPVENGIVRLIRLDTSETLK